MKELWFIRKSYSSKGAPIILASCPIVKETEKQFHVSTPEGGTTRVGKETIDLTPNYSGSTGKFFTGRQVAINTWVTYYQSRTDEANLVLAQLLALDVKKGKKK